MKFRATIERAGVDAAGINIPEEVMAMLPNRRAPVRVTINGFTYRNSVGTVNGRPMVGVSADVRRRAGVATGDGVDVELVHDDQPREVAVPADLAAALEAAGARAAFDGLSYSKKRAIVEPLEAAKTAETRQRRIDKALEQL